MADGSSMIGKMSLENKLVDQIGTIYDTRVYLKELIGEDAEICS